MENKNIKKSKGRPQYVPDFNQLKELYEKIDNKELTNEQGWNLARLQKDNLV
jgi:hypothetical protein